MRRRRVDDGHPRHRILDRGLRVGQVLSLAVGARPRCELPAEGEVVAAADQFVCDLGATAAEAAGGGCVDLAGAGLLDGG